MGRRATVALALLAGPLACGSPAAASTIVYICDKDLCRADQQGRDRVRLTRDGAAGAYSRPTLSLDGKRLAFKRGTRGRAYTTRLRSRALADVTRIGPAPGGPRDATQFDAAISPDGKRVAWVEQRVNVVFNTIDYRRYMAPRTGRRRGRSHRPGGDRSSRSTTRRGSCGRA